MPGATALAKRTVTARPEDTRYTNRKGFPLPGHRVLPTVMSTPPTVTLGAANAASTITNAYRVWPDRADAFAYNLPRNLLAYGGTFPDSNYFMPVSASGTNNTTSAKVGPAVRLSFFHYGQKFEVIARGGTSVRVMVDGQYVTASNQPTINHAADSNQYADLIDFGSTAYRRIDLDFSSKTFIGGLYVSPADTVTAAPTSPSAAKVCVVSDSFGEGTGANAGWSSWVDTLSRLLGVSPWSSSWGGTGYLNPNTAASRTKVRDRLQADVINGAPDIIIWAVSYNDVSYATAAAAVAEAQLCWDMVKTALPNARHIVVTPWWSSGPEAWSTVLVQQHDLFKAAAAAYGFPYIDLLQQPASPLLATFSTTLSSASSVGTLSLTTAARPAFDSRGTGCTAVIGSGTTVEYRTVKAWTGGGPFSLTFNGTMVNTHAIGEPITLVGAPLWSGTGRVGATGGTGNVDVLVSSDAVHPTQAGHDAIARAVFEQIAALATTYPAFTAG